MREIKFRAWDKKNKIMQNVNEINFLHNFVETYNADEAQEEYFDLDDCELMQYTGLKDRNGVMIYEGDIIKWVDSDGNIRINDVFFENGSFRICNSNFEISEYGELEVLGNIYENPELLGDDENVEM